jgi:hypothetical protein
MRSIVEEEQSWAGLRLAGPGVVGCMRPHTPG